MSSRLIIEQIGRTRADGQFEAMEFKEGVNAIVGPQNTGKSTWLRMLDFLMGESESAVANFDEVLVQKYRSVSSLIRQLELSVSKREQVVNFEEAGEHLSEGFNTYLNTIREKDDTSWTKTGQVTASISERRTQLQIGGRTAKRQLGGTLTIYFLFAYHYALLNLSKYPDCHYPGLTVLDFYPDIAREAALADRLHLVLGPFVELSLR